MKSSPSSPLKDTSRLQEITARLDAISAPEWEETPNFHGDPFVSEKGRGTFGRVATLSSHPADYGRGNMKFVANAPADMRFLLQEIARMQNTIDQLTTTKDKES